MKLNNVRISAILLRCFLLIVPLPVKAVSDFEMCELPEDQVVIRDGSTSSHEDLATARFLETN